MLKKVLVANRGEIALRILRACKELDIKTVVVHSTADEKEMFVRLADESVCIGPPQVKNSYLNIPAIISAATIANADAIHPGIGMLSENSNFAKIITDHGFKFIGPKYEHIQKMANKIEAKSIAKKVGLPILPGSSDNVLDYLEAKSIAEDIGYPVIIKSTNGGGGRGIKVVLKEKELKNNFLLAKREAELSFGSNQVYIEKYLCNPRHIEIQVLCDNHGNAIHLGERECSIQRRNQKIIEECPSPAISDNERKRICETTIKAMKKIGYFNIGTVEYLYSDGNFFFMEMNTRLQVEHTVTEEVYNIDIVKEQINISSGKQIALKQEEIKKKGHSIECRINAENPITQLPSTGLIRTYHPPGGPGIRIDSALYSGCNISSFYDGLISKLVCNGNTRHECIMKLKRALDEYVIEGVQTNIPTLKKIIQTNDFIEANFDINWLNASIK
ncbi:MAG: acetyl-CoA carboxylase biotin carboxylase subunit [Pelagibacteraceae bacterium TMED124]|nr:acetyl-CoA carboxylase biotin carboxylase subunit [Rickettsiales bacterium]RPG16663.1 MAG: acetyl-CoA carboxylase biotin carboxylase subunit [Pelagibacteraceae bacterium TMED124]